MQYLRQFPFVLCYEKMEGKHFVQHAVVFKHQVNLGLVVIDNAEVDFIYENHPTEGHPHKLNLLTFFKDMLHARAYVL